MLGALAGGNTTIHGLLLGEDPHSTAACFRNLGAQISVLNDTAVTITGAGGIQEPSDILDAGNSGTTMRLMLGVLAAQPDRFFTITGDKSLRSRPMGRVIQPLLQMGAKIWGRNNRSQAPLAVQGQDLKPIHYKLPVASAQIKSCLLLAGLFCVGETRLIEPIATRDHSERMLKAFGADLSVDSGTRTILLQGSAKLIAQSITVPGDMSSAAFWLVAASIVPGSDLLIKTVGVNPTRASMLDGLKQMGADIQMENYHEVTGEPVADLRVRYAPLKGCTLSGEMIPRLIDEIPILAVAAAFAKGKTVIRDAAELRVKESDRISAMAQELSRLGAQVTELPDGLEIIGGDSLSGTLVNSHHDHRVAMSLAIAALRSRGETQIAHPESISISYPDFVTTLTRLLEH